MRILIIEDNEYKYRDIKNTLVRCLEAPEIDWEKSRNGGLLLIKEHNYRNHDPYDMVICDNYMPIYDDENNIKPLGLDIVREIRERFELKNLIIVMCSSEEVEESDYNYKIRYDQFVSMDEIFKEIIDDIIKQNNGQILKKEHTGKKGK